MTIHCIGAVHWRPTSADPFGELMLEHSAPPHELTLTLDEYAAERLRHSVERAADPVPEPPEGL